MDKSSTTFRQKLSLVYLWLVPPVTVAIGFSVGPVSAKVYLPVWVLNVCFMTASAYYLGVQRFWAQGSAGKRHAVTSLLLLTPWLLFPIFAGMGPPPATAAGWVATVTEQQTRYDVLIAGGIIAYFGFALLNQKLKTGAGGFYAQLGLSAITIALPLFVINMVFWGSFLSESFKLFTTAKRPEWYAPIRELFYLIGIVEVSLLYLATAAFAEGLKRAGFFNRRACNVYIIISLAGFVFNLFPPSVPEPFGTLGYLTAIPAIPFIMPYLIGINLLKKNDLLQKLADQKEIKPTVI